MSKEKQTHFKCDYCTAGIIVSEADGFPYNKGWVYLYKVNLQVGRTHDTNGVEFDVGVCPFRIEKKDKHFCSARCATNFFIAQLVTSSEDEKLYYRDENSLGLLREYEVEEARNQLKKRIAKPTKEQIAKIVKDLSVTGNIANDDLLDIRSGNN